MRYKYDSLGFIDKEKFARSYAQQIMRDHIDGKQPAFLPYYYDLEVQPYRFGDPDVHELFITDGMGGMTLGAYCERSILQRHRYRIWQTPQAITDFFDLDFDDFLKLHGITDQETTVLAKLRWS